MTLFDVLQEGRLAHGGSRVLREQVLNAGVKATPYGWRLTKVTDDAEVIDAAVALAMVVYLAESEANAFAPSFARTGGVWSIPLGEGQLEVPNLEAGHKDILGHARRAQDVRLPTGQMTDQLEVRAA